MRTDEALTNSYVTNRSTALNAIAVDNKYRARGIGEMLTKWGVHKAHQAQQDVWLISAPTGKRLYLRVGFEEVAQGSRFGEAQYVMTMFRNGVASAAQ